MNRIFPAVALALGCVAWTAHAQESTVRSKTKSSGGEIKTETYTGCVQTGTETKSYILNKVVPTSVTTTTDANGTTTATTFMLVPSEKVEIQQQVGHKVEVTGMRIPAGEVKSETKTSVDREHGKDSKTRERIESNSSTPQFRVTSIRSLAERCE
jgi:hypothetical protein